ncbi:3347_t:CDS:2, partial [Cetraspora pellucida]
PSRARISKKCSLEAHTIPIKAFDEAARLIENTYLDKNGGVYKYVFECWHAGKFHSKKVTSDPSQQCNKKLVKTEYICFVNLCWLLSSVGPVITKMNLSYYCHTLNPDTATFANTYRQFPQNIIDKIEFYVKSIY